MLCAATKKAATMPVQGFCTRARSQLQDQLTMDFERVNRQQALIALVQILSLAVWFSASAVGPTLQHEWGISSAAGVWLTASVQIGFVAGAVTSTMLGLADRFRPQRLLGACAAGAALTTGALAAFVDGLVPAIALRFLTGVFLAGVYPVGMKLMASWSAPALRGKAFGILIGALTLGSAVPHLISSMGDLPWRNVMATAATLAGAVALTAVLAIRPGSYAEKSSARLPPDGGNHPIRSTVRRNSGMAVRLPAAASRPADRGLGNAHPDKRRIPICIPFSRQTKSR